jgi:hypothetical protein
MIGKCNGCHCILLIIIDDEDPNLLHVEQCKNCCEDAYDDGVLMGAVFGAPKVEQEGEDFEKNIKTNSSDGKVGQDT